MRILIIFLLIHSLILLPLSSGLAIEQMYASSPKISISTEVVEFFTMGSAEAGEVSLEGNGGFGQNALTILALIAIGLVAIHIIQNAERLSPDMMAFLAGAAIFLVSELMHTAEKIEDKKFRYQDDGNNDQVAAFNKEIEQFKEIEKTYEDKAKFQTAATVAFGIATAIAASIYLKKSAAKKAAEAQIASSIGILKAKRGECLTRYVTKGIMVAPSGATIIPLVT